MELLEPPKAQNRTETAPGEGLAEQHILPPDEEKRAIDWRAVEKLGIQGMTPTMLADKFDISANSIRIRAFREKWPVEWKRGPVPNEIKSEIIKTNEVVLAHSGPELSTIHANTALKLAQATAVALGSFAQKPAPVESWQDAKTAYSIQRLACGVDREGVTVNLGLGAWAAVAVQDEGGEVGFREVGPDQSQEQGAEEG